MQNYELTMENSVITWVEDTDANGKKLLKTCRSSDVSKLTGLKGIGADAFQTMNAERDKFTFRIPDGVEVLD